MLEVVKVFFSLDRIFSTRVKTKAIRKEIKDNKNRILVKNDTAIATPPKAIIPNTIAMMKNKIAQSNNILISPL
jgi:hypothetical protein